MTTERPPTIDPAAARHWAQLPSPSSAWLHEEVGRRMAARLDWIVQPPSRWLDWEPLRGGMQVHEEVRQRYPDARCFLVESSQARLDQLGERLAKPWWHPARWRTASRQNLGLEPPAGQTQMLWANMALHMSADPQRLIAQWHRALAVDGFLMFSCFGPDTLRELRDIYGALGWPPPAHAFTDMHDWGDMLVQAGFAQPVMDMERIELSFETPQRLVQELRELGRNLHPQRFGGLRGRGWQARLMRELAKLADPAQQGRLKLGFEIIYGHAIKPAPRQALSGAQTFSLEQMRDALTNRKPSQESV